MFDERGLTDRARGILFWFTIVMIVLVAVIAVLVILSQCSRILSPSEEEAALTILPAEVSLCPGDQRQFTLQEGGEATWETTDPGGTISQSGGYAAGAVPGDYTVKASRDGQGAVAVVHIVACTPTPTYIPTIAPTQTPVPPTASPALDPQGDVELYDTELPASGVPAGVDIQSASVQLDNLHVVLQPAAEDVPAEFEGWATEGEALVWISLYDPIPDPPLVTMRWIFVLDLDGNATTGRTPGSFKVNRGLGDEVALLLTYGGGGYTIEAWVWDNATNQFTTGPGGVRYKVSDSRTVVALAFPLDTWTQSVLQHSGVTVNLEAVKGRVAVDTFPNDPRVIDYYPNP
jgi:hypothetical protein